jgi:hypothetical protein
MRGPRDRGGEACARARRPGQHRRGRLFDELLVVALHGAVALAEVHHVAVLVGHELDLHVAPAAR